MTLQQLMAQITANAPECPAYQVNGFLLEFLERIKLQGSREIIDIDTSQFGTGRRYTEIPTTALTVHSVYLNGYEVPQTLEEADVLYYTDAVDDREVWGDTEGTAATTDDTIIADIDGSKVGIL